MTDTMAVSVDLLVSRYNPVTGNSEILLQKVVAPEIEPTAEEVTGDNTTTGETDTGAGNEGVEEVASEPMPEPMPEPIPTEPEVVEETVYTLPYTHMSVTENGDQCVDRLIDSLGATEQLVSKVQSGAFTSVNRDPEQRTIGILYVSQLADESELEVENGEWFTCSSEPTKVVLSTETKTIIAYRDGRAIGDATLALDHTTMITSVM